MKQIFFVVMVCFFTSCTNTNIGESDVVIHGQENLLPPELKGLKVFDVTHEYGTIKVAVLNNEVNSLNYGKHQNTTLIVNQNTGKAIPVSQILFENDSIVVAKK